MNTELVPWSGLAAVERHLRGLDMTADAWGSGNLVIAGPPGSGKTTGSRLIAEEYARRGITGSPTLTTVPSARLVSGDVTGWDSRLQEILREVAGGTLVIDSAHDFAGYLSTGVGSAVSRLTELVTRCRGNIPVILTGYPTELHQLFEATPELNSNFPTWLTLDRPTAEELTDMIATGIGNAGHRLEEAALDEVTSLLITAGDAERVRPGGLWLVNYLVNITSLDAFGRLQHDDSAQFAISPSDIRDALKLL